MCEKCGKPLVIKWGKHGSFLACTGYPTSPPRAAEGDLESSQKDIATRQERARKDIEDAPGKIRPGMRPTWKSLRSKLPREA